MSDDAEKAALESNLREIENYLAHPITQEIFKSVKEEQDALISLLCNRPICNVETFFAHFEVVGHLKGLRSVRASIEGRLEDLKKELEDAH